MSNNSNKNSSSPAIWRGAAYGLLLGTLFITLLSTFDLLDNNTPLSQATIYFLLNVVSFAIISALILACTSIFAKIPTIYKWSAICFVSVIYYFFIPEFTVQGMAVITLWSLVGLSLTGAGLSLLVSHLLSKTTTSSLLSTLSCLFLGIITLLPLAFWLFTTPTTFSPLAYPQTSSPKEITLPNPSLPGKFHVNTLSYGNVNTLRHPVFETQPSLKTPSVDGSNFIGNWNGISGKLRSLFWGFDSTEIPLNGYVWYPEGQGSFPLVLIVHGNHEMSAPSDMGYAYLGELLASHGFITITVDQNFLNSTWYGDLNETPARGWLILEHLKLWRQWNEEKDNPFHHKVDMDRIALIGHSRGGEAIATAAALNRLKHYPNNGNITFDYDFNIRALAAIAPVDAHYKPGGVKIKLDDIDYLTLQGSHDGDVRSFEGSAQFHRIHFSGPDYHFKTALYILGANHGQFNSLWGLNDNSPPSNALYDFGQVMPAEQQQQITKVYISAFLEASLNKERRYLPLFRDFRTGRKWLPHTLYFTEFADSTFQYIENDDKEKDIDITKTTLIGGSQLGKNLTTWRQGQVSLNDGTPIDIGTYIGWNTTPHEHPPSFIITLPEIGLSTTPSSTLILNIANGADPNDDDTSLTPDAIKNPVDFSIKITDSSEESATLPLSNFAFLLPPLNITLMKSPLLDPTPNNEYIFQSFQFPLKKFSEQNPSLNLSHLKSIQLIFNISPQGLIILESLALGLGDPAPYLGDAVP